MNGFSPRTIGPEASVRRERDGVQTEDGRGSIKGGIRGGRTQIVIKFRNGVIARGRGRGRRHPHVVAGVDREMTGGGDGGSGDHSCGRDFVNEVAAAVSSEGVSVAISCYTDGARSSLGIKDRHGEVGGRR